jgi:hypothetical protein
MYRLTEALWIQEIKPLFNSMKILNHNCVWICNVFTWIGNKIKKKNISDLPTLFFSTTLAETQHFFCMASASMWLSYNEWWNELSWDHWKKRKTTKNFDMPSRLLLLWFSHACSWLPGPGCQATRICQWLFGDRKYTTCWIKFIPSHKPMKMRPSISFSILTSCYWGWKWEPFYS